jgi:hypothetical protein
VCDDGCRNIRERTLSERPGQRETSASPGPEPRATGRASAGPPALAVLRLQQTAGNAAVQALLRSSSLARAPKKPPPVPSWLSGIPNPKHVRGQIWDIQVANLGTVYVGPYRQLTAFLRKRGLSSGPHRYEAAHIANWEHLEDIGSPYSMGRAPAVAVPAEMHSRWTTETTLVQKEWHGGRDTATHLRAEITRGEAISVHAHLYEAHPELRRIAANVLRQSHSPGPTGSGASSAGGGTGPSVPVGGSTGVSTKVAGSLAQRLLGTGSGVRIPPGRFRTFAARAALAGAGRFAADVGLFLLDMWANKKIIEWGLEERRKEADKLLKERLEVGLRLALLKPSETVYWNVVLHISQVTGYVLGNEKSYRPRIRLASASFDTEPLPFVAAGKDGPILTGERSGTDTMPAVEIEWSDHGMSIPLEELLREAPAAAVAEFRREHAVALEARTRRLPSTRLPAHYSEVPREDPVTRPSR